MAFLYVLQPRLRETLQKDSPHLYIMIALVLAIFFFLSPFTPTLAPGYEPGGVIMDNKFLLIFYFALGALVGRIGPIDLKRKILWLTIFVISSLLIFTLTEWEKLQTGHVAGNYYNYENPLVILASLSLFALLRSLDFKFTALDYISRNSLAIYGIHAYVLTLMVKRMGISESDPIPQMLLIFTATLAISLVIALTLKRADRHSYVT
jgi:surface polysaccharide O-acyltransferase-like enzyme